MLLLVNRLSLTNLYQITLTSHCICLTLHTVTRLYSHFLLIHTHFLEYSKFRHLQFSLNSIDQYHTDPPPQTFARLRCGQSPTVSEDRHGRGMGSLPHRTDPTFPTVSPQGHALQHSDILGNWKPPELLDSLSR